MKCKKFFRDATVVLLLVNFLLTVAEFLQAQTVLDTEKAAWLAANGCLKDGCSSGMNTSQAFALIENGSYSANQSAIDTYLNGLRNDESWFGGNRGAALIAMQFCYWENGNFSTTVRNYLLGELDDLPGDDYYWGPGWNNGSINCATVRYIMALKTNPGATCQYGAVGNPAGPETFTWDGKTYTVGQRYNTLELCRDWLYSWMDRFVNAGYIHGEIRSETYAYHYLNCLITLADSRMVSDATMRARAAMTADLFLLEHGMASNGHHLSGPLGRTYMTSHLTGNFWFFPFEYFGGPYPVHYGHPGSWFIANYRLPSVCEDAGRYNDEGQSYTHIVQTTMQRSYSYITKLYTLGSGVDGGNWTLEINSNDPGPHPLARPGFNFRLWMNNEPRDLDPQRCIDNGDSECYSEMGTNGHQYRDAILVAQPGLYLHEALDGNSWDSQEGSTSSWRFSQENGVAVAIKIDFSQSGAIEVSRLGIDEPDYQTFKNNVNNNAHLNGSTYTTRRGDVITVQNGNQTYVNGVRQNQNWPRLAVTDVTNINNPVNIITNPSNKVFVVTRHGNTITYNFNDWTGGGGCGDQTPPVISSVAASNLSCTAATITWTTNEGSDSQVEYGLTTSYGNSTPLNTALVTSHSAGVSGLAVNTLYHYRVKSRDNCGNLAVSGDFTFTTVSDNQLPVISSVASSNITSSSAAIAWSTNEGSDSQVEYGLTTSYGSSTSVNPALVLSHSLALSGLTPNTLYHYRVKSKDGCGNLAVSGDFTFTTLTGPVEIVIDDNAGAPQMVLNAYDGWEEVTHLSGSYNGAAHWHWNNAGAYAIWQPAFSQSGTYDVYIWWGDGYGGLGANVPYEIHHASGTATVYMNQNTSPGQWHLLGQYTLSSGNYVKMTDASGGTDRFVVADAIKFVLQGGGTPVVAAPAISPNGGSFSNSVTVTLSTTPSDATIRYTTDGTTPTSSSTLYSAPFTLTASVTVKARGFKSGYTDSDVASAGFTITSSEIIIDDNAGSSQMVFYSYDQWEVIDYFDNSYGGSAHRHWNNSGAYAKWQPTLSQSGDYDVYAWWGDGYGGLGVNVPYTIYHANGNATVYKNQNTAPGQWHLLGRYTFNSGSSGYVKMTDASGGTELFVVADAMKFVRVGSPKAAQEDALQTLPTRFTLSQNHPNPFNIETRFTLTVPDNGRVTAVIYNINGQEVVRLHDGDMPVGDNFLHWNGKNVLGQIVNSGVYLLQVRYIGRSGIQETITRSVMVVK